MSIAFALAIVLAAQAIVGLLHVRIRKHAFCAHRLPYINNQLSYQLALLATAMLVLVVVFLVNRQNLDAFLGLGHIAATATGIAWLHIPGGMNWIYLGTILGVCITFATSTIIFLQFRSYAHHISQLIPYLPWVLLFASINSLSEEIIYRIGVIVPLYGIIDTAYVLAASAFAFGLPHFRGIPSGLVGVTMASLLGWILAKSVTETGGLFWAWLIHSLQDIVIFSFVIAMAISKAHQSMEANSRARK